jgi:hypothetical protein
MEQEGVIVHVRGPGRIAVIANGQAGQCSQAGWVAVRSVAV